MAQPAGTRAYTTADAGRAVTEESLATKLLAVTPPFGPQAALDTLSYLLP